MAWQKSTWAFALLPVKSALSCLYSSEWNPRCFCCHLTDKISNTNEESMDKWSSIFRWLYTLFYNSIKKPFKNAMYSVDLLHERLWTGKHVVSTSCMKNRTSCYDMNSNFGYDWKCASKRNWMTHNHEYFGFTAKYINATTANTNEILME